MNTDQILDRFKLKYEDLNTVERETLNSWLQSVDEKRVTLETVKQYIESMKESVEQELTKVGHESHQDIFLKARLRNYMLLEAFLQTPEKAKKALEQALLGIARK